MVTDNQKRARIRNWEIMRLRNLQRSHIIAYELLYGRVGVNVLKGKGSPLLYDTANKLSAELSQISELAKQAEQSLVKLYDLLKKETSQG